jgi:hypothetical protein
MQRKTARLNERKIIDIGINALPAANVFFFCSSYDKGLVGMT